MIETKVWCSQCWYYFGQFHGTYKPELDERGELACPACKFILITKGPPMSDKVEVHLRPEEVDTLVKLRGIIAHVENAAGIRGGRLSTVDLQDLMGYAFKWQEVLETFDPTIAKHVRGRLETMQKKIQ